IDYTGTEPSSPCNKCLNVSWDSTPPCTCTINFTLEHSFESNVFMYYGLSNFYQNHRRYVKSRDDSQLNGDNSSLLVGIHACVLFSPVFEILYCYYFCLILGTTKPVNWPKPVYMLDSEPDNNGFINEDFIVWMRTAALPTFRKLYRLIERKNNLQPTLQAGKYSLDIAYNYPVHSFDGRKRMILSTISWMGGKNPFLGIAYITVGSICFFLGVVLLIIHHKYGNRNTSADIPN
ncbi:CC50A protein, partial [Fregetta grallaria]|nr:CC50A protein [Fregetta grallaria]